MEDAVAKSPRFQKPLLVFLTLIVILGTFSLGLLVAFNVGKSQQKELVSAPTPVASAASVETTPVTEVSSLEPVIQATPTPSPSVTSTPSPSSSPSLSPSPSSGGILSWFRPVLTAIKPSETQVLGAIASLDGLRASNGGGNTTVEIKVGRNNVLLERGFVSFDLTVLPADITVQKATLKLYQAGIVGNPYGVGGSLIVDHLDYGSSLDGSDYNRVALASNIGTISTNNTIERKELEVTEKVKNDLTNSRTRSQYRLRFSTEAIGGTVSGDFARFESAENSLHSGNYPLLEVVFKRN